MRLLFDCLLCSALLCSLMISSCATIVKGTTQSISISSNVNGASLLLDGVEIGSTPFHGVVPKNNSEVKIVLAGYRTETIVLNKTLEPLFWGNIISGGTLGSLTDFVSGAAFNYAPASYQVELQAEGQSSLDYEKQLLARKFSMIYIGEISRDMVAGEGAYLSAIMEITGAKAMDIRAALEISGGNQIEFGKAVVSLI